MEVGTSEIQGTSTLAAKTARRMDERLFDIFINIPISEPVANQMLALSAEMDAPKLQSVRALLQKNARILGTVAAVSATVADLAITAASAAIAVEAWKKIGGPDKQAMRKTRRAMTPVVSERTSVPYLSALKKQAIGFGAAAGGALVFRPISRFISWESRVGLPIAKRIGAIMNTMAGGSPSAVSSV